MPEHVGHRDNPAVVCAPGDLDRACARVWQPSEAQAAAGNYKMAHAILGAWDVKRGTTQGGGIHVTIETPLDRNRSGIGPDGTPWSVRMPAHYGYVKGSRGADGDHVDVYVGPEAHRAAALPVFVVDQCDADTRRFDEHKAMIGFRDRESARQAYLGAFSDGRGHERIGGVARTSFEGFRRWLDSGNTKKPVVMRKSASAHATVAHYGAKTCSCTACTATKVFGESSMTTPAATETSPTGLGKIMAFMSKGIGRLTPTEQAEMAAEAGLLSTTSLSKASAELELAGEHREGIMFVDDQWDGPPDGRLKTVEAYGPESSVAPGDVNVGPNQAASGDGASKMEREYSRPRRQYGVEEATMALGRAIAGMRGMRKSLAHVIGAVEAQSHQIAMLKSTTAVVDVPDAAAIQALVDTAVAKAIASHVATFDAAVAKAVKIAVAKAERERDDEGESEAEDEAEEATKAVAAKAEEKEKEERDEEEDEGEDEAAKSAARLRLLAKTHLKLAKSRLVLALSEEAEEDDEDDEAKKRAERHRKVMKAHIVKAEALAVAAKSMRRVAGPSTEKILSAVAKAKKSMKPAENQDTWPDKEEGRGAAKSTPAEGIAAKALEQAASEVRKAMEGMGMLSANMNTIMNAFSAQSRGVGGGMPPAIHVALAKGGSGETDSKIQAIRALGEAGKIDLDAVDNSIDVVRLARMPAVAPEIVASKIARLHPEVQAILNPAA
jgi:hypothetical protein